MAAEKHKKKIVGGGDFDVFEHLLTQNPTNQDSQLS